jgi:hypothetical protein
MGNRDQYRDGVRTKELNVTAKKVIEWFFRESEATGVAFELVIDATMKHDDIPRGEIDHIIRVVGVYMGEMAKIYPKALIIPETRNEWNAHSRTPLQDVNMWATRWWRDNYWPGAPLIVSPGGSNEATYRIGGDGYRAYITHPERGGDWENVPVKETPRQRRNAKGFPVGYNESMYLVEKEDLPRVREWYRPSGWTADFSKWVRFYENARKNVDYFIIHDEKGAQCDPNWPRSLTRVERMFLGNSPPPPDPGDPPPPDPPPPPPPPPWKIDLREMKAQLDRIEQKVDAIADKVLTNLPPPLPPPDPEPDPDPPKKPVQYIPWDLRQIWADTVDNAYSLYRGHRDLAYLAAYGTEYLKGGSKQLIPLTTAEIQDKIDYMFALHQESQRLQYRIVKEKHRKYEGRSQVRKDVANALIARLRDATADYNSVRSYIPNGDNYDSIRGFIVHQG